MYNMIIKITLKHMNHIKIELCSLALRNKSYPNFIPPDNCWLCIIHSLSESTTYSAYHRLCKCQGHITTSHDFPLKCLCLLYHANDSTVSVAHQHRDCKPHTAPAYVMLTRGMCRYVTVNTIRYTCSVTGNVLTFHLLTGH